MHSEHLAPFLFQTPRELFWQQTRESLHPSSNSLLVQLYLFNNNKKGPTSYSSLAFFWYTTRAKERPAESRCVGKQENKTVAIRLEAYAY